MTVVELFADGPIVVFVNGFPTNKVVKLAIDAPSEIEVLRGELV